VLEENLIDKTGKKVLNSQLQIGHLCFCISFGRVLMVSIPQIFLFGGYFCQDLTQVSSGQVEAAGIFSIKRLKPDFFKPIFCSLPS
jgi:hypothetical protein